MPTKRVINHRFKSYYFGRREIAEICGVSRDVVTKWISCGVLSAQYSKGRHLIIEPHELREFLVKNHFAFDEKIFEDRLPPPRTS